MDELHMAVRFNNFTCVREILHRDPSCVNDRNADYKTPLHLVYDALEIGETTQADDRLPVMQLLLDYGADVNARDGENNSPLHIATYENQVKVVELLLERGADPNLRENYNDTPLHIVTRPEKNDEIVNLLIKHGAEVNALNWNHRTPLDYALDYADFSKAKILMNAGAKAKDVLYLILETYWHCRHGDKTPFKDLIKFLNKHESHFNSDGRFSIKAVYFLWVCFGFDAEFLEKVLRAQGVDIDCLREEAGVATELHYAIDEEDEFEVKALLKAGADVNAKTIVGETPLHVLLEKKNVLDHKRIYRIAKLLIKAGADLHVISHLGFTPFQMALSKKHPKIVNLMLAKITGVKKSTLTNRKSLSKYYYFLRYCPVSYRMFDPLAVAITLGYEKCVKRFIEIPYHIETTSNDASCEPPPFYHAVQKCHYGIAKLLLEADYQVNELYPDAPYSIPLSQMERCRKNELEFICLLWEYNCTSVFRTLLIHAIQYITYGSKVNKLVCLLVFYYKIGLCSNKLKGDFVSTSRVLVTSKRLSSIFNSCDDQLNKLKSDLVCDRLSKYDLLTMKLDTFVKFLNDEDNFRSCQDLLLSFDNNTKIKSYEYAIKIRIDLATEKRRLLDCAKDCLSEALQDNSDFRKSIKLPDETLYDILSYLNVRELKKMSVEE